MAGRGACDRSWNEGSDARPSAPRESAGIVAGADARLRASCAGVRAAARQSVRGKRDALSLASALADAGGERSQPASTGSDVWLVPPLSAPADGVATSRVPARDGASQTSCNGSVARGGAGQASSNSKPTVGIVGLGLIGGSFARAYRAAGWRVLAFDTDADALEAALIETVASELADETLPSCDLIILAAYPAACIGWLEAHATVLGALGAAGPLVIDTAGVKGGLCERAFAIAEAHGFSFCGTHPMAGTQFSGFAHARADLFAGAPMVLVPPQLPDADRLDLLDRAHTLLAPIGFGSFSVATPEEHDRVIAFTSQLAHVVSNAYVKSPTAQEHHGFSAGSYRDLTRVAHLNARMWSELMMDNRAQLSRELSLIIDALTAYRDALDAHDKPELHRLLAEGDAIKRALDDCRVPQKR